MRLCLSELTIHSWGTAGAIVHLPIVSGMVYRPENRASPYGVQLNKWYSQVSGTYLQIALGEKRKQSNSLFGFGSHLYSLQ
jgi:hypothetical protein